MKILSVLGTRPEAIKMAPLQRRLQANPAIDAQLCLSGQHRDMLAGVLALFDVVPDHDLAVMHEGQTLTSLTARLLESLTALLARERPDAILVHGDTTTTLTATLAALYAQIPLAHVEAGLRTGRLDAPWPEEANRRVVSVLGARHYAPTAEAHANLLREGHPADTVRITGNTVIDALQLMVQRLADDGALRTEQERRFAGLDATRRTVLVTGHRRENFGGSLARICAALTRLAARDDVQIVYPVHPNPNVRAPVHAALGGVANIHLLEPLDYLPFVYLMQRADVVVTDSGGIQEEAPSLGKPVLVTRDTTERPDAVSAGTVRLVGSDEQRIVDEVGRLLDDPAHYARMANAVNPYGDGTASQQIESDLLDWLSPDRAPGA